LGIGGVESSPRDRLFYYNGQNMVAGRTTLAPGTWHHVALVRSGDEVKVYLDGDIAWNAAQNNRFVRANEQAAHARRLDMFNNPVALVRAALDTAPAISNIRRDGSRQTADVKFATGETVTLVISSVWPVRVRISLPVAGSSALMPTLVSIRTTVCPPIVVNCGEL
jgi:hypothetical protein